MSENEEVKNTQEEMISCPACGEQILKTAKKCKHCGEWLDGSNQQVASNVSAATKEALPEEYKRFNWGAFLATWIWGVVHKSYLTLLIFAACLISWIPVVGWFAPLGLCIWFGIKGNEWAWQNKEWKSLEEFNEVQRKWAMWSAIIYLLLVVFYIFFIIFIVGIAAMSGMHE